MRVAVTTPVVAGAANLGCRLTPRTSQPTSAHESAHQARTAHRHRPWSRAAACDRDPWPCRFRKPTNRQFLEPMGASARGRHCVARETRAMSAWMFVGSLHGCVYQLIETEPPPRRVLLDTDGHRERGSAKLVVTTPSRHVCARPRDLPPRWARVRLVAWAVTTREGHLPRNVRSMGSR